MLILANTPTHEGVAPHWPHPCLGRLIQPKLLGGIEASAAAGMPWAADNDAFAGWDESKHARWIKMLDRIAGLPGCLWVTVPDVVGDRAATDRAWEQHHAEVTGRGLPAAYVFQDAPAGEPERIPWHQLSALFIGGTDEFKLGPEAAAAVAEAKRRGVTIHMGRVNSVRRMRYAAAIGCDTVDGATWSRFADTYLAWGLGHALEARAQLALPLH